MSTLLLVLASLALASLLAAAAGLPRVALVVVLATAGWAGAGLAGTADSGWYAFGLVTAPAWSAALAVGTLWSGGRARVRDLPSSVLALAGASVACLWARALFHEPFSDPGCHTACIRGPFTVAARPDLARGLQVAAAVALLVLAAVVLRHLLRRQRVGGGRPWPGVVVLGALAVEQLLGLVPPITPPERLGPTAQAAHVVAAGAVFAVAAVATLDRVRLRRRLAALRVALATGSADGGVEALLGEALADPSVRVGHVVSSGRLLRADGTELGPQTQGRRRTTVAARGALLAEVEHDESVPAEAFSAGTGPAVLAAIVNEGLRIELESRISELAASRARVVARADEERARLERDLHDGAQQSILALTIELRRLRDTTAATGDDPSVTAAVDRASASAGNLLERVRAVARGIHPATLDGGGLEPALRHLTDHASPPVLLTLGALGHLDPRVERAAHVIAREACDSGADELEVRRDGSGLVLVARRVGPPRPLVRDRAAVAGGSLATTADGWEVWLPCG